MRGDPIEQLTYAEKCEECLRLFKWLHKHRTDAFCNAISLSELVEAMTETVKWKDDRADALAEYGRTLRREAGITDGSEAND